MKSDELIKSAVQKMKHGLIDEAIVDLKQAVELDGGNSQAHNYLGIAYAQKGMKDEAIIELRRACDLNPTSPLLRFNLGMAFAEIGHTEVAKSCFIRALLIDPNYQKAREALLKLEPVVLADTEHVAPSAKAAPSAGVN